MGQRIIAMLFLSLVAWSKAEVEKEAYRLSEICVPYNYEIELTILKNFHASGIFFGKIKILFMVTSDTREIEFHTHKLSFKKENIYLMKVSSVNSIFNVVSNEFNDKLQKSIIKFDRPLPENSNYTLYIDHFEGALDMDMQGFYRAKYKNAQGKFEWIATTQFEPTYARRTFPCFDEPHLKSVFNVVINHPPDYHALSNADVKEIRTFTDSKQTIFDSTPRMSTYTLAFAITKYVSLSVTQNKTKHAVWTSIETIPLGQYALSVSPKLLTVMEKLTNVPYSISNLSTVNHLSVPDFSAGAMENWGLITYRETSLLWNPLSSSARNKQKVGTVIAHELSHMWFGNLVTTKWWSSTWLNEGFARFFEYMALAEVEKDWELENQFIVEQQQSILISDALGKSKPITNSDIFTPNEISGIFDSITYSKGGSIVRMMSLFLGKQVFYKGLQSYLSKYKFNSTEPVDLFNELNNYVDHFDSLPANLSTVMSSWTEKSGFPIVTVQLVGQNIILQQNQFGGKNSTGDTKWYVPITYATSVEKNFDQLKPKIWMLPNISRTTVVDVWKYKPTWIVVNVKASAYVRVNYEDPLWDSLQVALNKSDFDGIIPINRALLVDDAMNLARTNVISYKRALNILSYLNREVDYYPWYSAFSAFTYLRQRIEQNSELGRLLNEYIRNLMETLYENVTSRTEIKSQIQAHKEVLTLSWSCKLNMSECVSQMNNMFDSLKDSNTPFNPNLRDVVYCTAVRYAKNSKNWEYLWKRLENAPPADEIPVLLSALGCTSNETILVKYLSESVKDTSVIRRQDGQMVFRSVILGSPNGVDIGLNFLINNFKNISERYGGMNALSTTITVLADRLTTKKQVSMLEDFISKHKNELKDAVTAAGTAIENAKKNLEWVDKNKDELLDYFRTNRKNMAYYNSPSIVVVGIVLSIFAIL